MGNYDATCSGDPRHLAEKAARCAEAPAWCEDHTTSDVEWQVRELRRIHADPYFKTLQVLPNARDFVGCVACFNRRGHA